MRIDERYVLTMTQTRAHQCVEPSTGLKFIEPAEGCEHPLEHLVSRAHTADNLEGLVGADAFDSEKHRLQLSSTSKSHRASKQAIQKRKYFNLLALHFEVLDKKSFAKPLQYLILLKEHADNCRRRVKPIRSESDPAS